MLMIINTTKLEAQDYLAAGILANKSFLAESK